MAQRGRWQERDRYRGGADSARSGGGDYGRDFGAPYRGPGYERDEETGRWQGDAYGAAGYNAINSYGSNYGGQRSYGDEGFDRPRGEQRYRTDSGWQRDSGFDRDQWARRDARGDQGNGRGWWDRTTDEVSSWFGDHDAERRRQADELQGRHRGRGPKGYTRSDERIREEVCDRLSDDPHVDASGIEVAVASGEVTLTGTADSRDERRRAEDCAERVSGVTHVQNNVRVAARKSDGDDQPRTTQGEAGRSAAVGGSSSGRSAAGAGAQGSDPYSRGTNSGATGGSPAIDVNSR